MEKRMISFLIKIASIFLLPAFIACSTGHKNEKEEKVSTGSEKTDVSSTKNVPTIEDGWQETNSGDSTRQKHLKDKITLFEGLLVNRKRIYNKFYPQIQDAFLFEDKFYLKALFPLDYSGKIEFAFPEYPDFVLTKIGEQAYQVVINDALDLNRVVFHLQYLPSKKDSLVRTDYTFTHVVYGE
ncbi:hypothetical protein [Cyclobacterium plantarum]|uniref:Lipoprotein n=1 Tax=Cyclobacterium plantarum TaxID=2716263 RepID=A0ABX0H576_9BACT|nr:hypothetical protein [Cyclobacterium plantarum]NHE57000.1 hypothetical protein [Cyclobacterium plantarum]